MLSKIDEYSFKPFICDNDNFRFERFRHITHIFDLEISWPLWTFFFDLDILNKILS